MIYLDNAATTYPKPREVYEKTLLFMREGAGNPGRGSHHFAAASASIVEGTRRQVASFFGVKDHRRVIFTYNCTDSINMILKGHLKQGDHVIATHLDHNSVSRPLEKLRMQKQIEITRLPITPSLTIDPDTCLKAIRNNTTLIVLNHGSNVVGSVQRLRAISANRYTRFAGCGTDGGKDPDRSWRINLCFWHAPLTNRFSECPV